MLKSTTCVTQAVLGALSKPLTVYAPQNNGTVFTKLLTKLSKSGAPTQQDAAGGMQPQIFAAKSANPDLYSLTQTFVLLAETARASLNVCRAPNIYRSSTN